MTVSSNVFVVLTISKKTIRAAQGLHDMLECSIARHISQISDTDIGSPAWAEKVAASVPNSRRFLSTSEAFVENVRRAHFLACIGGRTDWRGTRKDPLENGWYARLQEHQMKNPVAEHEQTIDCRLRGLDNDKKGTLPRLGFKPAQKPNLQASYEVAYQCIDQGEGFAFVSGQPS
ncbi:hypothetical protein GWK47_029240 [Chionoecetes opilio]|uniref:Uncharacterized protein n=1 Tax=Chionoecetes opilio TaxID=41210 RepID=A0A8J5D354_CHIOP|nr:hypothetical protein GWK47_029240 [Chionoecetes opilio]